MYSTPLCKSVCINHRQQLSVTAPKQSECRQNPLLKETGGPRLSTCQSCVTEVGEKQVTWLLLDQDQMLRNLRGKMSYASTGRATRETVRNKWTRNASLV